jgi:hypothetical protein
MRKTPPVSGPSPEEELVAVQDAPSTSGTARETNIQGSEKSTVTEDIRQ